MGNVITFAVDNSLTKYYYPTKVAVFVGCYSDMTTNPAVAAFVIH